jgi:hypothetical protein
MPDHYWPTRAGDSLIVPIQHTAGLAAMLREGRRRPVGVATARHTPEALAIAALADAMAIEWARRRLALRATTTTASAVVAQTAPPSRWTPDRDEWKDWECTVAQAARIARVSAARIRALVAGGHLGARRTLTPPPGPRRAARRVRWAVRRSDVEAYAAERRHQED